MNSADIRSRFFSYFNARDHKKVESSSLIPAQDPTLLFANAGMNQFKDIFLGLETRSYQRAVSIQKCVRAGGKHNDLDNVGFTGRHLTFFEMMGNFSFGDYFKKEAIQFAWEFLTKELGLSQENMYATIYETDDESFAIWNTDIGLSKERIYRLGKESNFWQMGDIGPCGPCSEIFVDQGPAFGCADFSKCGPDCDCDRFLEIWNLVFMQFDRQPDGTLNPLKKVGVDTGMGLERLCGVLQKTKSVYQTDLFMPIIKKTEALTGKIYAQETDLNKAAFHVLADHIRSASLLISDGCAPSNEGRGYVLRKIIRRAALFAQKLTDKNIFPDLSPIVIESLGSIYPSLIQNKETIHAVLLSETKKFSANLVRGTIILNQYLDQEKDSKKISGKQAFVLYDTYGFPVELTVAAAKEIGYRVDLQGFEIAMAQQKEQSGKKETDPLGHLRLDESMSTEFTGYQELVTNSTIQALICNAEMVDHVAAGTECYVIAKKSPFFIVGGGQVPDQGTVNFGSHTVPIQQARYVGTAIAVKINAPTALKVGDSLTSAVDPEWRTNAMKNHTATHLLQGALMELFGSQIKQSGSLVHPDYLRFDFTYHDALSSDDIKRVEKLVNEKIRENLPVSAEYMTLKEATNRGALAFFGDKYKPEKVRMIQIDEFSKELCGGTHVHATGDIGTFKITENTSPSAGHRRIVAITGPRAIELYQELWETSKQLCTAFSAKPEQLVPTITKQQLDLKNADQTIAKLKMQLRIHQIPEWIKKAETVGSVAVVIQSIPDATTLELRDIALLIIQQNPGLCFLMSKTTDKTIFYCGISQNAKDTIDLKNLSTVLKDQFGMRGGGEKLSIQGGGDASIDQEKVKQAIIKWLAK